MEPISTKATRVLPYIRETRKLTIIAGPLILSSLVSMGVSIIDLVMMARLNPHSLAAGAIVSDYYSVFFYFFAGIIASSSALLSQSIGAKDFVTVKKIIHNAAALAFISGLFGLFTLWQTDSGLKLIGIDDGLISTGLPYAQAMGFTFIIMLGVNLLHYILSAHGKTSVIFYASVLALPLNALGNYGLMFGNFGLPELGLAGAGWSSFFAASVMFVFLLMSIAKQHYSKQYQLFSCFQLDIKTIKEVVRVGLPIGISNLGEMGVFLLVTVLMGRFGAEAVAAHIVALRMAGVIYAIPLGYAQAATVRIGLAIGAQKLEKVRVVFFTSLIIASSVGLFYLLSIGLFRQEISLLFLDTDSATQEMLLQASLFLLLLAISQPIECIGTIGSGILRGFKDTQSTMFYSLIAFWGIGFIGGNTLAFYMNMAGTGLWFGLAGGSIAFGLLVLSRLIWKWKELLPPQESLAYAANQ